MSTYLDFLLPIYPLSYLWDDRVALLLKLYQDFPFVHYSGFHLKKKSAPEKFFQEKVTQKPNR